MPFLPARLVKSDGMRTLVRKFRLCQSVPGLSPTRVTARLAPFSPPWITFRGLFFEKGIGTVGQPYKLLRVKQKLSPAMTLPADLAARKSVLRREMLDQLRAIPTEERSARSAIICERVLALQLWRNAERVLLFSPMKTEPNIAPLSAATKQDLKLVAVIPRTLRHEHELELPFVPDLVLVPGLAFSRDGHRLGRGGGFYDRLLAGRARDAAKIGVGFASQLREDVPRAEHDVILDAVVTD
jgi:5-formyltetrahydrofolate cyclo-ligase